MDLLQEYLASIDWESFIFGSLRILLILVIMLVLMKVAGVWMQRLERHLVHKGEHEGDLPTEAAKRAETLVRLLRQAVIILLWLVGILIILREIGLEIGPVLASAGVVGLAVGFGAQNLVRDIIAGFFIILENQIRVGDVAVVNGTGGLVESVNFRTMVLRDMSGTVHVFQNGTINTLSNMTRDWSGYVMDIGIAYKEDPDRAMEIMRVVGSELREDPKYGTYIIEDLEIFGVDAFGDSAVVIKARLKTTPIKQWEIGREYRRRLKHAFDKAGIEIPFPHMSVYFGEASKPFVTQMMGQGPEGSGRDTCGA